VQDHIRFIDHRGNKILLVDMSDCPANEVEEIARAVPEYVTVNPPGSVFVLTDFTGAAFDRDALRATRLRSLPNNYVKQWKVRRRPPLNDSDVALAIRRLNVLGWIVAVPSAALPLPEEAMIA
jgi:hypothetical protein